MNETQLSEIFKTEYSNLVAVLCHYYGLNDIQLAEDIVSETFFHHRRKKTYNEKVLPRISTENQYSETAEITEDIIEDSQLRMMFLVCDPMLKKESQLSVALRILCGFNIDEIAKALLSNKETINKRLYRAKKSIKEKNEINIKLTREQYISRLDNVLRLIYLLFNEGYYSSINESNIRRDICWEALRLCIFLSNQNIFPKQKIHALLALICFHISRLDARESDGNGDLLYNEQDKEKWNQELILKGEKYLNLSAKGKTVSKYHLEAAIAYWHTVDTDDKWNNILQLYNKLLTLEYSPIIALNRTYALAMANSNEEAIHEAHKLELENNHHYYCMLAELYRMNNNVKEEIVYLNKALEHAIKKNEKKLIKEKILRASQT